MIRRRETDDLFLVTQEAHASLAGRLAEHWGNQTFPAPYDRATFVKAVTYHDAGWSLHDTQPTLNEKHIPATFYEMPVASSVRMWVASVAAASARSGPMGGLLTSLHFTNLARFLPLDGEPDAVQGLVRDFMACQQNRQRDYCASLELTLENAKGRLHAYSDKDREILRNYAILRAVDWMSLVLCARELPALLEQWRDTWYANGELHHPIPPVRAEWRDERTLGWSPWPLDIDEFVHPLPVRRVPEGHYRHHRDLQRVYAESPEEQLPLRLVPLRK